MTHEYLTKRESPCGESGLHRRSPDLTPELQSTVWADEVVVAAQGYCQVDEKLVDRPPRYWARASREPAILGIKNGRQPQLDNTTQNPMVPLWKA